MFIQIVGLIGAIITLLAYMLVSLRVIDNKNLWFHLLNFVGAALMGILAYNTGAWPIFGLDILWCLIASWGIIKS